MKVLIIANLVDEGDLSLARRLVPSIQTRYGVDLTLAIGIGDGINPLPESTCRLLSDMDVAALVSINPMIDEKNLDIPLLEVPLSGKLVENKLCGLRVCTARLDTSEQLDDLPAPGREDRRGPAILFLSSPDWGQKMGVLEKFRKSLSALIGTGTGIPTADAQIVESDCAFICDIGIDSERPIALCKVSEGWANEPRMDTILISIEDSTGIAQAIDRRRWGPADCEKHTETFNREAFYYDLKKTHESDTESALLENISSLTRRIVGHERVAVGFRSGEQAAARFLFSDQIFPDDHEAISEYLTPILEKDEVILVPDKAGGIGGIEYRLCAEWNSRTDATPLPLRCVLAVAWPSGRVFSVQTEELIGELYKTLRTSLLRLQFNKSLRSQIERSHTLLKISAAFSSTIDLDDLLKKVMELTSRVLQSNLSSVLLLDKDSNELVFRVATGSSNEKVKLLRFPADKGIAGWVVQNGRSQIVNDPASDPRHYGSVDKKSSITTRNLICVPLKLQDSIIGVLEVLNKKEGLSYTRDDLELLEAIANQSVNPIDNARLHKNLRDLYLSTVETLASAIDAKDKYTHGHSRRVTEYAQCMALELGWSDEEREELLYVGLLHDIGKIGVEDAILTKNGALTEEERRKINLHPTRGAEILEHVSFLVNKIPGVRHHHERFDGKGYPDGLSGDEIPINAQIICIVDAFDAMTSDRPYRSGMEPRVALSRILECSGTQFAPRYVEVFERIFESRILPVYNYYKHKNKDRKDPAST